jgi:hypothetical protein
MRDITNRLRAQLDRLVKRQPQLTRGVTLWDLLASTIPPTEADYANLDPASREMLGIVADLPAELPDRVAQRLAAALAEGTPVVVYGLRELASSPDADCR